MTPANPTADAVRAELARARKTQTAAAEVLGMVQASLSRRLTGEVEFTVAEVRALAEWLGVPLTTLLGEAAIGGAR